MSQNETDDGKTLIKDVLAYYTWSDNIFSIFLQVFILRFGYVFVVHFHGPGPLTINWHLDLLLLFLLLELFYFHYLNSIQSTFVL